MFIEISFKLKALNHFILLSPGRMQHYSMAGRTCISVILIEPGKRKSVQIASKLEGVLSAGCSVCSNHILLGHYWG